MSTDHERIAELSAHLANIAAELGAPEDTLWRCLPEVARELRERVTELEAERTADEFGLQGLAVENGVATLTTSPTTEQARELVLAMSLACARMLDDDQAPNYVEFEVSPANQPGHVVHVRRAAGPSPHTLRREAEARAELAETRVAELEAALRPPCWYAVAEFPGDGLPPNIEDTHPTRDGAEDEAQAMRDEASFSRDCRVYEVREVQS